MANLLREDRSGKGASGSRSSGLISYDTVEENINVYLGNLSLIGKKLKRNDIK